MATFDPNLRQEAEDLKHAVTDLSTAVGMLATRGRVNRILIWGLGACLVLGAALGVAVWRVAVSAQHATSLANRNRQIQVVSCQAANESRAQNKHLWDFIILLSRQANPHPTKVQADQLTVIEGEIAATFAPRDCQHLSPAGLPTLPASTSPPSSSTSTGTTSR